MNRSLTLSPVTILAAVVMASACGSRANSPDTVPPTTAPPSFSPPAGSYASVQHVAIASETPDAAIYFTRDGTAPTPASARYAGVIEVSQTQSIRAIAVSPQGVSSSVAEASYAIELPVAAAPTFAPEGGSYDAAQSVTLSTATPGGVIHYSVDGSAPTAASPIFEAPIRVDASTTIRAITTADGLLESAESSASYAVEAKRPRFSPGEGASSDWVRVSLEDASPGATVRYTLDGATPGPTSAVYFFPFTLSSSATVQAYATLPTVSDSPPATYRYTVSSTALAELPFGTTGCFPSGAVVGTHAVAISRSSSETCPIEAGEQTCSMNQFCVTERGLLIQPARTQLYPTPTAPAPGVVTHAVTGPHWFWVTGPGSQTLSATGTLVATGLPCTATPDAPCHYVVTSLGTTPTASLGDVSGVLSRGQIEAAAGAQDYPTSFIPSGTRSADLAQFAGAGPLWGSVDDFCVELQATPLMSWSSTGALWRAGSGSPSASLSQNGGQIRLAALNAAGTRYYDTRVSPSGDTKRIRGCLQQTGRMAVFYDGVQVLASPTGAGSGALGALPPWFYIGSAGASSTVFGGYLSSVRVDRLTHPMTAWAPGTWLWIGDSIFNGSPLWTRANEWAATDGSVYPVTNHGATCNGHTVALGLLELADETHAFEAGAWYEKSRGVPFSAVTQLIFEFGANDAGGKVDAYRRGYDKILDQARKAAVRTCAGGPPPHSYDRTSWASPPYDFGGTGGHYAALTQVWAKWGVSHFDTTAFFRALTRVGLYSVADLSADGVHATPTGVEEEAHLIAGCALGSTLVAEEAAPEISGRVVNELFGAPSDAAGGAGAWALVDVDPTVSCGQTGQLYRIAGYPAVHEKASQSSTVGDHLTFREYSLASHAQIYLRYFVHSSSGGWFRWWIDRGTAQEITGTVSTLYPPHNDYAVISKALADDLPAGSHRVEVEVIGGSGPVRILGATYVGVL